MKKSSMYICREHIVNVDLVAVTSSRHTPTFCNDSILIAHTELCFWINRSLRPERGEKKAEMLWNQSISLFTAYMNIYKIFSKLFAKHSCKIGLTKIGFCSFFQWIIHFSANTKFTCKKMPSWILASTQF